MIDLPIDNAIPDILQQLRSHTGVVIVAPPGAGKTTRVPPAILAGGILQAAHPHVIMLQPRRVAARAAAMRIADEQRWTLGEEVGFHIRFEKKYGSATRVRVLTEAILTRMLLATAALEGIGAVILDEFHERNLHTDLTLAMLREVRETIRPDLKIVVMSATLDAQEVADFLGVSIVESAGRLFPVEVSYHPPRDRPWEECLPALTEAALGGEGDVLIFLPGVGEIERARRRLAPLEDGADILALHGSLSAEEQQRALRPADTGRRKIILATNIAETSLTIDGVRTVIDLGLARVASFDGYRGMNRLDLERISKASADQRAGRAGRQGPGRAMRLWSEQEQRHMADFGLPEIHRVDLAETVLMIHAWGARDIRKFGWFDLPQDDMLDAAERLLATLGALKDDTLTETGRQMLQIPAHPRISRMLLAALDTRLLEPALTLAAILADDSRTGSAAKLNLWQMLEQIPPHLTRPREQLAAAARDLKRVAGEPPVTDITDLLLLAYPDRIARRRENDPYGATMVGGAGVRLTKESLTSAIADAELFLALDAHLDPRNRKAEALVHLALPVEESSLERLYPGDFHSETTVEYSPQRQKPIALRKTFFRDMLLRESQGEVDAAFAGDVLGKALAARAEEHFRRNQPAARILSRVALLREYMPEHPWPVFNEQLLHDLMLEAAADKRTLAELTDGPALADALGSTLYFPLDRLLNQHAPDALTVPSGSRVKLEYGLPAIDGAVPPPILAVRLQELFGWSETPRIANGRIAVLLHLLSPGFKPIQITSDLASFWKNAYFEVRKELRVRYPKHKWPDDPLKATPEAKGRRH